jgi:hypothetical protein
MGLIEGEGLALQFYSREVNFSFVIQDLFMKTSGDAEVKTHTCLTWAPGEVAERMILQPLFTMGKILLNPLYRRLGGPRPDLNAVQKR